MLPDYRHESGPVITPQDQPNYRKQAPFTYNLIDRVSKADLLRQLHHASFDNATRQPDWYRLHR